MVGDYSLLHYCIILFVSYFISAVVVSVVVFISLEPRRRGRDRVKIGCCFTRLEIYTLGESSGGWCLFIDCIIVLYYLYLTC